MRKHVQYGDVLQSNIFSSHVFSIYFRFRHFKRFFFFCSLFETSQSLFWASFGLVDLMAFELQGIKSFTRFWALLMFGSYSVINIIVLLNMLIAMMSNSYQIISVNQLYLHPPIYTLHLQLPSKIQHHNPKQQLFLNQTKQKKNSKQFLGTFGC